MVETTQEGEITLRDFQAEDREIVKQLLAEMNRELQGMDPEGLIEHKAGADEFFVKQILERVEQGNGFVLLAEIAETRIGMVAGFRRDQNEEEKLDMKPAIPGMISDLFVIPGWRRKGLGKRLLVAAEGRLKEMGCDLLSLEVFVPNTRAVNFYRKVGYQDRGMVMMKQL